MSEVYEFRIDGAVSADLLRTFDPATSTHRDGETVFTRAIGDEAEFAGVLMRCQTLGLKLVGLRRTERAVADDDHLAG